LSTPIYEPERFRSAAYLAVLDHDSSDLMFNISKSCIKKMQHAAEAGYPLEICGLLVGQITASGWQVHDIRSVINLNEDRAADRFQLDPAGYQAIDRELRGSGLEIIGVYHSHPDCPAKPSPTDLGSAWEGFAYPIISVCDGQALDLQCWEVNSSANAFQNIRIEETSS